MLPNSSARGYTMTRNMVWDTYGCQGLVIDGLDKRQWSVPEKEIGAIEHDMTPRVGSCAVQRSTEERRPHMDVASISAGNRIQSIGTAPVLRDYIAAGLGLNLATAWKLIG
jgi:hypothetical protein